MADNKDESDAISALTGFSLNHLLDGMSLPSGSGLSNQLGISGLPSLNSGQIYNESYDEDDEAIGNDQGEDWESQIDQEMQDEDMEAPAVKTELRSPDAIRQKQRRVRIVKRLVERPKSVYERFPAFQKDKILDFSELFKGYTVNKSRLAKRPFHSEFPDHACKKLLSTRQSKLCIPGGKKYPKHSLKQL